MSHAHKHTHTHAHKHTHTQKTKLITWMFLDCGNILRRSNVRITNPIPAVIRNVVATRELQVICKSDIVSHSLMYEINLQSVWILMHVCDRDSIGWINSHLILDFLEFGLQAVHPWYGEHKLWADWSNLKQHNNTHVICDWLCEHPPSLRV